MSKIKEVLFLKEVNGVEEWFEDGNEETDAKYVGKLKLVCLMEQGQTFGLVGLSMKGILRMGKNWVKGH